MAESIRAFVALSLPPEAAQTVAVAVDEIRALAEHHGVRGSWTRHPHLTLVFLGQTALADVDAVTPHLLDAGQSVGSISLTIGGVGGFPSLNRPRVLWLGLEGEMDKLQKLQSRVAKALEGVGEHREKKAFNPHVTIGRLREAPPKSFTQALAGLDKARLASATITEFHLFRSELSPKGAKYTPLVSVPLEETD